MILAKGTRITILCGSGHAERQKLSADFDAKNLTLKNLENWNCPQCFSHAAAFYYVVPSEPKAPDAPEPSESV
jgi:hypothetical protein